MIRLLYQSARGLLAKLLTVDGAGSGLDADLLDGAQGAAYQTRAEKDQPNGYPGLNAAGEVVGTFVLRHGSAGDPQFHGYEAEEAEPVVMDGVLYLGDGSTVMAGLFPACNILAVNSTAEADSLISTVTTGQLLYDKENFTLRFSPDIALTFGPFNLWGGQAIVFDVNQFGLNDFTGIPQIRWSDNGVVTALSNPGNDAGLLNKSLKVQVNEVTNKLVFRVLYADGATFATAEVALTLDP